MQRLPLLFIVLVCLLAPARAEQVVFSEIMYHPAGTKPEYIEVWNITNTPIDFARWKFSEGVSFTFPDFNPGAALSTYFRPLERIVVSAADPAATRAAYGIPATVRVFGPWTGTLDNAGERITLEDKNGVPVCSVKYGDGGRWPKAADGAGHSLVLRNENNPIDSYHNWRQSQTANGTPGSGDANSIEPFANPEFGAGAAGVVVDYDATWKYLIPTSDPGTDWIDAGFDDSSWQSGPGLLGLESAALPAPGIQTTVDGIAAGAITYLFRTKFNFLGDPAGASFIIDQIIDDGVAYYLNGQPLGALGYNPGGLWNAVASRTVGDAAEELNAVSGLASALVQGENTLTAEVHQTGSGSSDIVFGARFKVSAQPTVVINEVKPGAAGQGFVEFFNTTDAPINLSGYYLSDAIANLTKFKITADLVVPANSFATIGFSESSLGVGATTRIYLTAPDGVTTINAIDGNIPLDGRSAGREPAGGNSWFLYSNQTPGAPNGGGSAVGNFVRLSEIHFDGDGAADWIELENVGSSAQGLTGFGIASSADFADRVPLSGSVPAGGFASVPVNFATSGSGNLTLFFVDAADDVIGTAEIQRVAGRDSIQAVYPVIPPTLPSWETPKRQAEWYASVNDTRDAANAPDMTTSIVINEIMCDPPSGQKADEFIELYNRTGAAVSLDGWKIRGGIDFDFLPGTSIPPGGYLIVAGSKSTISAHYPSATVVGDWSGSLGNSGDLIRLVDGVGNLADEVDYKVGGDWPTLAGGLGSSMELIHPDMDNSRASAWRDSDESNKTAFQTFTTTGTYRQLNSAGGPTDYKELHLFLVGDAHCIVKNVTLRQNGTGANVINNPTSFSTNGSSATGWLCQGTHWASYMDGTDLHLVSDGHGDNRPNRAENDATGLVQNQNYTLQFDARWVWGKPRLIAQTWDHTVGGAFLLPVPNNLGTAGAANSAASAAAPAQVDSLLHQPAVPSSSDPVVVTARVTSATPLTSVQIFHRQSTPADVATGPPLPPRIFTPAPMFDDGTNGDAVAGDGLYSATITDYQTNASIVEFYVSAAGAGGTSTIPRQGADRPALWIVDNRNLDNRLRFQRFIVSFRDRAALNTSVGQSSKFEYDFPRLANHYFNATFIHNQTDIYYNAEIRKSGSPWTRSDGNELDRGKWKLPHDRIFRNRDKSTFDNDATNSTTRHHNRLVRYWLYVLGHPVNENEFITQVVNTDNPGLREDTEPVDGALIGRNFPNGNQGQLMRSDDEWWFQDNWNRNNRDADWSYKGTEEAIRYHTEWMTRSREAEYDYSPMIEFFKTVSNGASTKEQLDRVLDPNLTLMMAAVRGFAGDWDSFTLNRGKNGFFYRKPTDGRWMFLHWDSDLAFQSTGEVVVGGRPGWGTYIGKAWNRRIFNYYLTEMLNLTTGSKSVRTQAFFAAEEAASSAYSVNTSVYQSFFNGRQNAVRTEINKNVGGGKPGSYVAPFASTGSVGTPPPDISGTAPSSGFTIVVDGHPEAVVEWINQTDWTINGLILATGTNVFTLRLIDAEGNEIGTFDHTIVKTGIALPAMALTVNPGSYNAALGETVVLDASGSFDPDGGQLTFAWQQSPATDVTISHPTPAVAVATIQRPGVYSFTATGTNSAAGNSAITREITAYHSADFSSFGTKSLEPFWTVSGVEMRDSYSEQAWYSLEETSGHLVVQVLDDSAKPLAFSNPTHPLFLRPLPASGDFALQTDVTLEARRTGSFRTGIYFEMVESGAPVRYAFGIDTGNSLTAMRSTGGTFDNVVSPTNPQAFSEANAKLRVMRTGNELRFQRRKGGVWATVATQTLPAGATATQGGVFLATSTPQSARVAFDYFLLADSSHVASLAGQVRITEMMYHPADPGTVEFIELHNTGSAMVNLQGLSFDAGHPFDAFTFGNTPLPAGGYAVITNSTAAFQARYGFAPAAEWPAEGGLSNGGERVTLRDDTGAIIHDFTYDNSTPWPTAPDGEGPSLVVIDPFGDYDDPSNWRASYEIGGSPGGPGTGEDSDGDGQPDAWEVLFGTDPNDPNSRFAVTTGVNGSGHPTIGFSTVSGVNYRIDYTDSLTPAAWQPLTTVPGTGNPVNIEDPTTPPPSQRFYRVTPLP
ncbi:MAG: lamin tail domain-containing protein [Chthoniobacteraceae bacterium]